MTDTESREKADREKESRAMAANLIFAVGLAFLALGLFNAVSPQFTAGFLNLPLSTVRMIAGGLAFIGVSDIFVAKFVLLKRETL
jgi:hypothetical protein